ncbi:protein draper-like [Lineus longissimus]|uniref:protein draper-like n=1 Tax=Lineus longissimus TaxID=88925 RepID=UPI002B4CA075
MNTLINPSIVLTFLILVTLDVSIVDSLSAGQSNVCSNTVYYKASRSESYNQPYRVKTYTWCWAVPPRCTNYLMRYRTAYRQVWDTKSRVEYKCCRGYHEVVGVCKPTCSFSCGNGDCTSPNVCTCKSGYFGHQCDKKCAPWKYGPGCLSSCSCITARTDQCDASTGRCLCKAGYKGSTCNEQCTANVNYGIGCKSKCQCQNGAACDYRTGACTCTAGFYGPYCEKKCPSGTGGIGCEECKCQNGVCDSKTALCSSCYPGWKGEVCSEKCPLFSWGKNCAEKCDCNGGECLQTVGNCTKCRPGYMGVKCDQLCLTGKYGQDCKSDCPCKNGGLCDPVTGNCTCNDPGFYGQYCQHRYCGSADVYGTNKLCDTKCKCEWSNTETGDAFSCHSITGACSCKAGWKGVKCEIPCSPPFYGKQCSKMCNCSNSAYCDPALGNCYCQLGFRGTSCEHPCAEGKFGLGCGQTCQCYNDATCNSKSGACTCKNGWTGEMCERTCKAGTHSLNCTGKCDCHESKGHGCNPMDGACMCQPGWTGAKCNKECPADTYGLRCGQNCSCNATNALSCQSEKGMCQCKSGFSGIRCTSTCPAKKWGANCQKSCNCGNSSCHMTTGDCECLQGYTGSTCSEKCPTGSFGLGCNQKCTHCTSYGGLAGQCDPVNGRCKCKQGFIGYFCERSCPKGYYGVTCSKKCSTVCPQVEKKYFDFKLGKSVTQYFTLTCDPSNGKCLCPAGRKGDQCQSECPPNTYGIKCSQTCACDTHGAASCRDSNGLCECKAGYTGPKCSERCPENYYGLDCMNKCDCNNDGSIRGSCNMVTGLCYCKPGWQRSDGKQCDERCSIMSETCGPSCTRKCPTCPQHAHCNIEKCTCDCSPGYKGQKCDMKCDYPSFGLNCSKKCDQTCPSKMCDHKAGCLTQPGNEGSKSPISGRHSGGGELSTGGLAGVIVAVVAAVVLVILIALIFYFKKKMVNLKQQKEISDAMRDEALENRDMGINNPTYIGKDGQDPMVIGLSGPVPVTAQNNLTYSNQLGQSAKQGYTDENPYDPYDLPTGSNDKPDVNVYDEAKIYDNIDEKVPNMAIDLNKPETVSTEPGSGYLTMSRSPEPLPQGTGTPTGTYVDPYSLGPKTLDPVYHSAYEKMAPPRLKKPPVAKKPGIPPRSRENAPKLPEMPTESAYQVPNPAAEDPYRDAYDHTQRAAPEPPMRTDSVAPEDMDDIVFEGTVEAHVPEPYDLVPKREPYDTVPNREPYDMVPRHDQYDSPRITLRRSLTNDIDA